jgi:hypothetical protein
MSNHLCKAITTDFWRAKHVMASQLSPQGLVWRSQSCHMPSSHLSCNWTADGCKNKYVGIVTDRPCTVHDYEVQDSFTTA